jgi:hypothetical protein
MSRAMQVAGSRALSPFLRAFQARTFRHTTNHLLRERAPCLDRRRYSTRVNMQDLPGEAAPSDLWEDDYSVTLARGRSTNTADSLRRRLDEEGHRVWGFVVYRCTYGDDAEWEECLRRLNAATRSNMRFYDALDLLNGEDDRYRFKQTIFSDAAKFDGASTQVVRCHFQTWRALAFDQEQGSNEKIEARRQRDDLGPPFKAGVRYKFCIQIDEAALQSILLCESLWSRGEAWVNLIEADWDLEAILAQREEDRIESVESGLCDSSEDFDECIEFFPEIEGCNEEDVGWMRVEFQGLIPDFYVNVDPMPDEYVRPPGVAS